MMEVDAAQYFSSYEDLDVHKLMLEDEPRTLAYRNAILNNKEYFKDKVVMDVGCGTGILSIFCAQAGAKKVFAVEASNLANLAKEIVKENNFENVIEVIHSRVEDVTLPNYMKVDAIVSEWMGFYLLHEGMLDSVLYARDRFLKDGGEIFPESAAIYIAPCSVSSMYDQWDNVYGVSMKSFSRELRTSKGSKPEILTIKPEDLLGTEEALCASKNGFYQGLCLWFECNFPELPNSTGDSRTVLDTSPKSPPTHWKQTVIVLPDQLEVEEGEPIAFQLEMTRADATSRRYNLLMTMLDPETIEHPLPCSCHMTTCILAKTFMMQQAEHAIAKKKEEDAAVLVDEEINDDDD
ncbi:hypothetical protein HF086_006111 [Spodoptera exigua]|uniref:type I protein arginine methyltransferase n=1 Tax=Spodoptera exigua TaxID=7107 RepID=A0A922MWF5_SPOEX|nr:hypothetical protein HF086_006111 [Spodoptera exigua]